jgi:glycine dehydrogenase subunit 1
VRGGNAAALCERLEGQGIIAGYDLGRLGEEFRDQLLVAVTEKHRRAELDRFVSALSAFAA